jgi:hypothetical protein
MFGIFISIKNKKNTTNKIPAIMKKAILLLAIMGLVSLPIISYSQKNTQKTISRYSFQSLVAPGPVLEAGIAVGAANAMTDISSNQSDIKISVYSINMNGISPAANAFVRYRFNELFAMKASLGALKLRGNDSWSRSQNVSDRGKFYHNNLYELAMLGEIYLPRNILNPRGEFRLNTLDFFLFAGASGFYHSPHLGGPILDEYDLVLQTDPNAYYKWQMAIPFGAGIKYTIANSFSLGVDFNLRYTFIDYLDGFTRPVTTGNDMFLTSKFNVGFILDDRRRQANHVANKYVRNPRKPRIIRSTWGL